MAKFEPRGFLDGRAQFGMLGEHQRWPVTTFQSQPVPNHECVGLGWQRYHAEKRLTSSALNALASDDTTHILPGGKAVPDRYGRILPIVALKQLVLHGFDRR